MIVYAYTDCQEPPRCEMIVEIEGRNSTRYSQIMDGSFPSRGEALPRRGETLSPGGEALLLKGEALPQRGETFPPGGEALSP
jgi:hypothetical protein